MNIGAIHYYLFQGVTRTALRNIAQSRPWRGERSAPTGVGDARSEKRSRHAYFVCITQTPPQSAGGGFSMKYLERSQKTCDGASDGFNARMSPKPMDAP